MLGKLRRFLFGLALRHGLYDARYRDYALILQRLLIRRGKATICLDLGCGYGFFVELLANLCNLSMGIDINKYPVWRRRQKGSFIIADARRLPFRTSSIDVIVAISLLEHVPRWREVLAEVSRVLRPGGVFIIQLPDLRTLLEPHTHFPFISLMPVSFRNYITKLMFNEIFQWDCTLPRLLQEVRKHSLEIMGVYYYTYKKIPKLFAMSYFIVAMKLRG